MKVTLLGFTVPDNDLQRILSSDLYMPTQTHSFAWAVVRALRSSGVEVTLLSVDPIASYPGNPRLVSRGGTFMANGVQGRKLAFVNLLVLKHLTRFVACLVTGSGALRSWRPDVLLVHGVHSPFLFYARMCQRFLGIPVAAILTDPPGFVRPSDNLLARHLKGLDVGLVRAALAGFDGVIALTESLATEFAPTVPYMVMEGIVDALPAEGPRRSSSHSRLLYAGALTATYGVDRMVNAVRALHRDDIRLSCFGRGDLANWVAAVSQEDPRIEAPQLASRDDVLREYKRSNILVQPRPVDQDFVRFSFPSKLLEYLASGTPVVSTRLPGIPADYEEHVHWADDDSAQGLSLALERALATPWHERQHRAAMARDFVWRTRGYEAQGRRMKNFLARLVRVADDF
jgi:glycosyltransferase involved in cell wall biosynthesis